MLGWLKGHSHDHNPTTMWKVYSHANVPKVKGAFSLKEPMSYYDEMLAWVLSVFFYECELKLKTKCNS